MKTALPAPIGTLPATFEDGMLVLPTGPGLGLAPPSVHRMRSGRSIRPPLSQSPRETLGKGAKEDDLDLLARLDPFL